MITLAVWLPTGPAGCPEFRNTHPFQLAGVKAEGKLEVAGGWGQAEVNLGVHAQESDVSLEDHASGDVGGRWDVPRGVRYQHLAQLEVEQACEGSAVGHDSD